MENLNNKLKEAQKMVQIGAFYHHYRNPVNTYKVTDIVLNEIDHRILVIYVANYGDKLRWARDIEAWFDIIEYDGKNTTRFVKIV